LPPLGAEEVVPLVVGGLERRLEQAISAGIGRERIVLDPGFGFGKRMEENYPLLARLDALRRFELPVMVGVSRKRFLARTLETLTAPERGGESLTHATNAAQVAAILAGAHIIRAHAIGAAVEAAAVADQILAAL
jgi:dihydropteroate synthase